MASRRGIPELPWELQDAILARLPLRDAARSSVLSSSWGRSWRHLGELDFVSSPPPAAASLPVAAATAVACDKAAIDAILLHQHPGPVQRVRLRVTDELLPGVPAWMASLSEKGIQSLDLTVRAMYRPPPHPMHRSIFACRALRRLSLGRFALPAAPEHFAGFPALATLSLTGTAFRNARDLEALVAMSPRLEELRMCCIAVDVDCREHGGDGRRKVRMVSSSLRFLRIDGMGNVEFVGARLPRVSQADFAQASYPSAPNLLSAMVTSLETLDYYYYALPLSPTKLLKGLPSSYKNLKRLKVHLDFNHAPPILSTLNFLRTAPNLTQLVIQDFTDDSYAQSPYPLAAELYGNLCPSLLFLQMSYVTSQNNEMDFIRLILSKARMLQDPR
ncbi:F-box/FBD/LRR-repeat protein At1g13570 [Oryza sativa Japonica Group]|uniref:F-box protein-like protein n=1 Tax=Oryza sativa subsp. japonica TaxID=39947 RepID=Q67UT4_ORYSJ|nr:F-box domain-containing protein [Oryza sativa Japonica Group]BAD38085.1 F-box protein-like protein [Oryza sativa Japonica Group]